MKKKLILLFISLAILCVLILLAGRIFQTSGSFDSLPEHTQHASNASIIAGADASSTQNVLKGRVITPEGEGIAGAFVTIFDDHSQVAALESDAQGYFSIQSLEAGNYFLEAREKDYVSAPTPEARRMPVALTNNPAPSNILEVVLQRPARITGKVLANNQPLEGAQLSLYYLYAEGIHGRQVESFVQETSIQTNKEGAFELSQLAPGRVRILVQADDFAFAESDEIYLRGGETRADVIITLSRGCSLYGSVVSIHGEPVRASLTLSGSMLKRSKTIESNARGDYSFADIPAGNYTLTAHAQGFRAEHVENIHLEVGDEHTHDVILQPAAGLFGRVVDSQNRPVPNARVVLRASSQRHELRAERDGTFHWEEASNHNWSVQAFSIRHVPSEVLRAEFGQELVLTMADGSNLYGRVINESGQPVSGYALAMDSITIEEDGIPRSYSTRSFPASFVQDAEGAFQYGPVRPGRYRLRVHATGFAPGVSDTIVVRPGQDVHDIVIRMGQGATLTGVISSEDDGSPIAGAQVMLLDSNSSLPPKTARTQEDGTYTLDGLPAGRHTIRVTHGDYLPQLAAGVVLAARGSVTRNIRMASAKPGERFSFHGIGAVLSYNERGVVIGQVNENGPAAMFGLQAGDIIRSVDNTPTRGLDLGTIVEQIRGEEGSVVSLEVERDGEGVFSVEVERGRVVVREM